MEERKFSFEKLNAYQQAKKLVIMVYQLLKLFPLEEKFALCDQLRRASVSIASNIAEGSSRFSQKDQKHFIEMSYGSLMEVYCQLQIALELKYISVNQLEGIKDSIYTEAKLLSGLRHSLTISNNL